MFAVVNTTNQYNKFVESSHGTEAEAEEAARLLQKQTKAAHTPMAYLKLKIVETNARPGHEPTCKCFACDPASRGPAVRERLSEDEPSVNYTIRMPVSLKEACKEAGPQRVREILQANL